MCEYQAMDGVANRIIEKHYQLQMYRIADEITMTARLTKKCNIMPHSNQDGHKSNSTEQLEEAQDLINCDKLRKLPVAL